MKRTINSKSAISAVTLLALVLAGCSGGSEDMSTSKTSSSSNRTASTGTLGSSTTSTPTLGGGSGSIGFGANETLDDINQKLDAQKMALDETKKAAMNAEGAAKDAKSEAEWGKWLTVALLGLSGLSMINNGVKAYKATDGDLGAAALAGITNDGSVAMESKLKKSTDEMKGQNAFFGMQSMGIAQMGMAQAQRSEQQRAADAAAMRNLIEQQNAERARSEARHQEERQEDNRRFARQDEQAKSDREANAKGFTEVSKKIDEASKKVNEILEKYNSEIEKLKTDQKLSAKKEDVQKIVDQFNTEMETLSGQMSALDQQVKGMSDDDKKKLQDLKKKHGALKEKLSPKGVDAEVAEIAEVRGATEDGHIADSSSEDEFDMAGYLTSKTESLNAHIVALNAAKSDAEKLEVAVKAADETLKEIEQTMVEHLAEVRKLKDTDDLKKFAKAQDVLIYLFDSSEKELEILSLAAGKGNDLTDHPDHIADDTSSDETDVDHADAYKKAGKKG